MIKTFDEAYEVVQKHDEYYMSFANVYAVGAAYRDDGWKFVIKTRKLLGIDIPEEIEGLKVVIEVDKDIKMGRLVEPGPAKEGPSFIEAFLKNIDIYSSNFWMVVSTVILFGGFAIWMFSKAF